MRASVVVPAHNAERTIGRTLAALGGQEFDGQYEVIVVDDGSTDGTAAIVEVAPPPVRLVRQAQAGAAAARDAGVAAADAPVIAFTDSDCEPTPGWLEAGLAAIDRGADVVQGGIEPPPGAVAFPWDHTLWRTEPSAWFETANLFVRRKVLDGAGGFEPLFPNAGGRPIGEDTWLGWRMRRAGARIGFEPAALVHHAVIPGRARDQIAERRRLIHFPALARQIPELRREAFYGGLFLNQRTAMFDAAVLGAAAAAVTRSKAPLVAITPYALAVAREALPWRRWAPLVAAAGIASDAVGAASLAAGSVRHRVPVL
jgi:glycosyltransferase involved in cell wall biosynthesis